MYKKVCTMQTYSDIIESLPQQMQLPMLKLMDRLRDETLDTVKRSDFEELRGVVTALGERVSDLALAQKNSEKRLSRVEIILQELAEAQKKTAQRVEELAEAQKRTEQRVEELAEAQKRTEQRVEELAEAQKRTEQRVEELVEAQRNTEKTLNIVVKEQKKIRKDFGGLSDSIGYSLEDRAIKGLPALLSRDLGLKIETLDRRFIEYPDGGDDEINIYGEGLIDEETVYIIGESKSQLGKRDVDRFTKFLARVSNHLGARVIPLLVTYSVRPKVEQYAREKINGLSLYMSFEI
jgi:hypothetical protein